LDSSPGFGVQSFSFGSFYEKIKSLYYMPFFKKIKKRPFGLLKIIKFLLSLSKNIL